MLVKVECHEDMRELFEIGTFDGGTTPRFTESASVEAVVYTLDLPEDQFDAT